ncbi:aldo/keto reductase [Alicyclobacillus shizuokensis]|uniref:aldo/keto reductase n=1 Tax=Alicyclobacillus shizuokensis TaxID=392014 RepID=UPI00082F0DD6|nr:aldo/keto reductase [Alicyclobacillus shizuokensis]MCL6625787.1 aldo/keto reductase [Alicyclobacillus shizuokensis]
MRYRELGNTGLQISEVSFGTWAIGGAWGSVAESDALNGLARAIDAGVNFFDTADVYGDGRAERLLAKATKGREHDIYIATKFCRAGDIHDPATYSEACVRAFCEASLRRLERDTIDLYQVHCPPHDIIRQGAVFEVLDKLQQEGKIRYYGVSVETVAEGQTALQYPGVRALQVIFNIFRQKPATELFPQAAAQGVGILARLPLASGLLTGKFKKTDTFPEDDHRNFNRDGQAFNVGETFAGLPFEKGVELADQLRWIAAGRGTMARAAMRWILDHGEVSCVIPGFKNVAQVEDNLATLDARGFNVEERQRLHQFYERDVAPFIRGAY